MSQECDVASVLERETEATIDNWFDRVEAELDLVNVPLSRKD
jgi:hypothetical protein